MTATLFDLDASRISLDDVFVLEDLPYPPTANNLFADIVVKVGGRFTARRVSTKRARKYREEIAACTLARRVAFGAFYPKHVRLAVRLDAYVPDRRDRDLANVEKALLDAFGETHGCGLYADDSQIDDLRVVRGPVVKGGAVKLTIAPLIATRGGLPRRSSRK